MAIKPQVRWPIADESTPDLVLEKFAPEQTYKTRVYSALKHAITNMDIYSTNEATWLDERQLSERLGISRTPVREAIAMLEQQGFVKSMPRRGIIVLRKTKREVIEMIQAWAALEGMAARLVTLKAKDSEIAKLRPLFDEFGETHKPADYLSEYSSANIRFHQTVVQLAGSQVLAEMTENLLLHVRGIRQITIGRDDRASQSIVEHRAIIEALEKRDTELAERLSRDHTLNLADYVEQHSEGLFD
ncbi:GntR family transcriptional regulator [Methylobrevis pamukkalensis]|uniref:Putative HTH-type transcriptional regulator YdfH n=1 Tax=Methylobrevis pamukkalensis TaxID=1439726 RepID=A0A1E3GZL7_9HYPH|nr:GntR family transcriptional regulator [Methylobrevis pamukkalensis]ODN68771.1 putative HTH-type transcriptional regulator YdfH [Methylobrevis pamukkalensis]